MKAYVKIMRPAGVKKAPAAGPTYMYTASPFNINTHRDREQQISCLTVRDENESDTDGIIFVFIFLVGFGFEKLVYPKIPNDF